MLIVEKIVNDIWENRELFNDEFNKNVIWLVIEDFDKGKFWVVELLNNSWNVNEWIKKAVILYFPIQKMAVHHAGPMEFYDKIDFKTGYEDLGVRVVLYVIVCYGSYVVKGVIMMLSFVNIGVYVDSGKNC